MSEIVNLNRFRKDRDLKAKKAEADVNAAKHGRTKAERLVEAAQDEQSRKRLDQLKFDDE